MKICAGASGTEVQGLVWLFQRAFGFRLCWKEPGILLVPVAEPVTASVKMQKILNCSAWMFIDILLKCTENVKAKGTEMIKLHLTD